MAERTARDHRWPTGYPVSGAIPADVPDAAHRPEDCPVGRTLSALGGRWKPLIVARLLDGPLRFGELRGRLSTVTARVLARQLRELASDGVVRRDVRSMVPAHVDYALTARGRALVPVLDSMAAWGIAAGALDELA